MGILYNVWKAYNYFKEGYHHPVYFSIFFFLNPSPKAICFDVCNCMSSKISQKAGPIVLQFPVEFRFDPGRFQAISKSQ